MTSRLLKTDEFKLVWRVRLARDLLRTPR